MRALVLGLAASLAWGGVAAAQAQPAQSAEAPAGDESAQAENDPVPTEAPGATESAPTKSDPGATESAPTKSAPDPVAPATTKGLDLLDRVLPCGTRVLVARDDSLPVASVILALEHGSEDDPDELPGLHHALAYQLLMGNRGTAPGGIQSMVQDAGGIAFLATGPAQTRFESLVPMTLLDELIAAEASRLRAPTVTESLWKETLISARRDPARRRTASWRATAIAHGAPGLGHRPREVPDALGELDVPRVQSELASRARYEFATMVVVAPLPLEDTFKKIEAALSDLPDRRRRAPTRAVAPAGRVLEQAKAPGNTFVWAVPGEPAARLWADAWCETISRQRRGKGEPKPNRVRCAFDDDPRRPTLTVRVRTPGDPAALLETRMKRLTGKGDRVLRGPRRRLQQALTVELGTPLGLARRLAASASTPTVRSLDAATGLDALQGPSPDVSAVFPMDRAVRIVAPGTASAGPQSETPAEASPAAEPAEAPVTTPPGNEAGE
ncbi:MAG: hypothetical protein ACRBN8_18080 [Nannocystales bacterium]